MKIKDLRKKNIKELNAELCSLLRKQLNLRIQVTSSRLKKSHLLRQIRRDIARIKTLLTEKEISN